VDPAALFAVVDEGFAERRKTMANALRRLGLDAADAAGILRAVDPDPSVRAERLGLDAFAAIARAMLERGWTS
jgi:16S rRNA (adenine1518-N6/adenine1519-N6)-dimethyltransferase